MSTPKHDDGGPAFPAPMFTRQADGQPMCPQEFGLGGMTLHDWFAGQALAGICAAGGGTSNGPDWMPRAAYNLADAMLAERRKGTN